MKMKLKRIVCFLLAGLMIFGLLQTTAFATDFTDVPENSYYHDAVFWALAQGITNGTGGTSFSPANQLTRGQVVTFLWRLAGKPMGYQNYASQFSDVSSSSYCFNAVGWAVYHGITNGTGNGLFSPNVTVTNKETITFMYRAASCNQISAVSTTAGSLSNLNAPASSWYYNACVWANSQGYLAAVPVFSSGFLPNSVTTRALAVYLFWEMKTGKYSVFIDLTAGTGIDTVTLGGNTAAHVSGYRTKGEPTSVSCSPSEWYAFSKWKEAGTTIGGVNPFTIYPNRSRTLIAVGRTLTPREKMVKYAENEIGNHRVDNTGYNITGHWCAAFSSWCAYMAYLACYDYVLIREENNQLVYYKDNYTTQIQYDYTVLRNTSCSQQVRHFCNIGSMMISSQSYLVHNSQSDGWDWTDATVYNTSFAPRVGDLVYFHWAGQSDYVNHVGIVRSVSKVGTSVTITTIEGNTDGTGQGSTYYNSSIVGSHTYTFDITDESKIYWANGSLRGHILGFGLVD